MFEIGQAEAEYFEKIIAQKNEQKSILVSLLRIWFAAFLAAKIDGTVDWNWGLVFLPVWVFILLQYIYALYFRHW